MKFDRWIPARGLRNTFVLAFALMLCSAGAEAALTVTGATIVDTTTVGEGTVFTLEVTVAGSGLSLNNRTWRGAQVLAGGSPLQCVDVVNGLAGAGILAATRTFNVAAPAGMGTHAISVIANNGDSCTGGTSSAEVAVSSLDVAATPATPITFVGQATAVKDTDDDPQEISVAIPAGSIDDLLLAFVTTDGPTDVAPLDPGAWTLLDIAATTGPLSGDLTQATVGVWYRVADGTEPATADFAWTADGGGAVEQQATAAILRYSGVDTLNPINAFAADGGVTSFPTAPDVTTTVEGAVIVRAFGSDSIAIPAFFPAGTGPAVTGSPVSTIPAPHGRFGITSNLLSLFQAVSSAASDAVQLGGAGSTGSARFAINTIPQQWRAVTVALAPAIDLAITKSESIDPVVAGSSPDNLTYVVTLTNNGVSEATTIVVDEALTLPSGVTAVVTPSSGTWSPPTWTVPVLAAGASETLTVVISVDGTTAPGVDVIGDTASITGADQSLLNTGDDTVTESTTVVALADVSLTKSDAPDPVVAGTNLVYTITVSNAGPSVATAVSWSDTLPANTTFASLASPGGWACATPAIGAGGIVSCSIASLGLDSAVFTLTVEVDSALPDGTLVENTATVSASTPDPDSDNDSDSAGTTIGSGSADVSVTKVGDQDPVAAGGQIQYTITLQNAGPSAAFDAMLDDPLPLGTTFASLTSPPGWTCATPAVGANGLVSCTNPILAVGSAVFVLTVTVDPSVTPGTNLENTATAGAATADPTPGNESSASQAGVVSPASLASSKSVSGDFVRYGTITYTIVLTNTAASTQADNPGDELTDILPSTLTLVGATATSGTATANAGTNTVTWNGSIPPGDSVTITIEATINGDVAYGSFISNQASIAFDGDGDGTNESSGLTDDPSVGGSADPTVFQVAEAVAAIPALDPTALLLLGVVLAMCGLFVMRRM